MKPKKKRLKQNAGAPQYKTENVSENTSKKHSEHSKNFTNSSPQETTHEQQINDEQINEEQINEEQINEQQINEQQINQAETKTQEVKAQKKLPKETPLEEKRTSWFSKILCSGNKKGVFSVGIVAVCVVTASIIASTVMSTVPSLPKMFHQLFDFSSYNIKLIEETENTPLNEVSETRTHKIRVENHGDDPVFLRIQLKEYMEVAGAKPDYYKDEKGDPVRFAATSGRLIRIPAKFGEQTPSSETLREYGYNKTYLRLQGQTDTQEYWYIVCKSEEEEGKFLQIGFKNHGYEPLIANDVYRAPPKDRGADHNTEECKYKLHQWNTGDPLTCQRENKTDKNYHDYIQWNLKENVLLLSELPKEITAPTWILDDCSASAEKGWAYWSHPLPPGESTQNLLESITLIFQPEGTYHYTIHADVEAITLDKLDRWSELSPNLLDYWQKQLPFSNSKGKA